MKVDFKKLTASTLSVAVLASLSGCAMFDKDDDAVLAVAEDYAEAVVKVKPADIVSLLVEPDDDLQEQIEEFISTDTDLYGEDYAAIIDAIEGTLAYEIDEESVESSKKSGKASVDITFTVADYAAAYESVTEDGGDLDAFIDAIADADKTEISQTIDFVLEDDEWLVDDSGAKKLQEVYQFYLDALDYSFAPAISADLVDSTVWYYSDNSVYTNYEEIELDILPTSEGQQIEWNFYYEYYLDGQLIFTSDECTDQGVYIEAYYGPSYDSAAALTDDGYLVAGQYRCIIYDLAGNVLADSTCTVENGASSSVVPASGDMEEIWENGIDDYWYTYADGGSSAMGTGDYSTSETIIEYTCQVIDEANLAFYPVYYEVYYSATGDMDDAEQVYSGTITPTEYTNGYFYEFQYVDNSGLDAGTYYLVGASDSNGTNVFFSVTAEVS